MRIIRTEADFLPLDLQDRKIWWEGGLFLVVLVAVRVAVMLLMALLTDRQEFADDWGFHRLYIEDPLQILLGRHTGAPQSFPPLVPVLIWVFGYPLSGLVHEFFVPRLVYIIYELLAWPFIWLTMCSAVSYATTRRILAVFYIFVPMAWTTNAVMVQEETISLLFFAATAWLVGRGRLRVAILVCAAAVVSAKVFFLVPLLGLVVAPPAPRPAEYAARAVLAAAPIAVVYAVCVLNWRQQGMGFPLASFTPSVQQSVSFWAELAPVLGWRLQSVKQASMVLSLIAGLAPLIWVKAQTRRFDGLSVIQVLSAMLLAVYTCFYHITPEYYIMLLAVLFVVFRLRGGVIVGYGVFSIAWVINLAYGVSHASIPGTRSLPGKARFVELYHRFVPIPAETLDVIATLLFAACTVWLTVLLTRAAAHAVRRPEPPPVE